MDPTRFATGALAGLLVCASVMFSLWLFDIVPMQEMEKFNRDSTNTNLLFGGFAAVTLGLGYLYSVFGGRK
jgi:hypothetical protein